MIYEVQNGRFLSRSTPDDEAQHHRSLFLKRLQESQIPDGFHGAKCENYLGNPSHALCALGQTMVKAAGDPALWRQMPSVYCWSHANGTQKTYMACAVGIALIRQQYTVRFWSAAKFLPQLLSLQGFTDKSLEGQIVRDAVHETENVDFVILDEPFDKQKAVFWNKNPHLIVAAWDGFLRQCFQTGRPKLWMTSNIQPERIGVDFSRDLYSLLKRNAWTVVAEDSVQQLQEQKVLDRLRHVREKALG